MTLCDAKNILRQLASYDTNKSDKVVDEAFQQITYADRIIISKLDLVAPALPCVPLLLHPAIPLSAPRPHPRNRPPLRIDAPAPNAVLLPATSMPATVLAPTALVHAARAPLP